MSGNKMIRGGVHFAPSTGVGYERQDFKSSTVNFGQQMEVGRLRRRVATLEARLARVLRYAMNHRKGAFGETREWKQLPVPMRSEDRPLLVRRGRVWSRKRAR